MSISKRSAVNEVGKTIIHERSPRKFGNMAADDQGSTINKSKRKLSMNKSEYEDEINRI